MRTPAAAPEHAENRKSNRFGANGSRDIKKTVHHSGGRFSISLKMGYSNLMMQIRTKPALQKKSGFGLIGLLIVVAIMLFLVFGYQKIGSSQKQDTDGNTSVGTYQPIGTGDMQGQLEAGFEAKQKASDAVTNVQNRAARNIQGIE